MTAAIKNAPLGRVDRKIALLRYVERLPLPGFYADMAKAFLEDSDAADGKAYLYWDCIADK
jgi:hypothetical protein